MISDPEMAESIDALSPQQRAAAHELAAVISSDLESANQPTAAWTEVAAYLIAVLIRRCRRAGVPDEIVPQIKEFVLRRAEALAGDQ